MTMHGGKNFGLNGIEFTCSFDITYPDGQSCNCQYSVDMSPWFGTTNEFKTTGCDCFYCKDHPSSRGRGVSPRAPLCVRNACLPSVVSGTFPTTTTPKTT